MVKPSKKSLKEWKDIANETMNLLLRRKIYRQFCEILEFNPALNQNNCFIEIVKNDYVTVQCMRIRRLFDDGDDDCLRLVTRLTEEEIVSSDEVDKLKETCKPIKDYARKHIAHKDKKRRKYIAGYPDLDKAIDTIHQVVMKSIRKTNKYSGVYTLDGTIQDNWREIFYKAWISDWKKFLQFTHDKGS